MASGAQCTVCRHPQRKAIDKAILESWPAHSIAKRYPGAPTHRNSYAAHRKHMSELTPEAQADNALSALEHASWLVTKLRDLAERSEVIPRQFLEVATRLDASIRTYGLLRREIVPGGQQVNNLFVTLGVRDESELKRRLDMTRGLENVTLDEAFNQGLALLDLVLSEEPERRHEVLRHLERKSYVQLLPSATTNGHTEVIDGNQE